MTSESNVIKQKHDPSVLSKFKKLYLT